VYVEPYGGGGNVLLRKVRSYAEIYNDLYGEVVNVFRVLQDPTKAERLRDLLYLTPFARASLPGLQHRARASEERPGPGAERRFLPAIV
jgi:site-specific DNA-adenine methylase